MTDDHSGEAGGPIRIILVDDQELVGPDSGWSWTLSRTCRSSARPATARRRSTWPRRLHADVMVMDARMPRLDGVEATRQIRQAGCLPRVLMLTTFDLDEYAFAALKAGASGFLLKDVPPEELLFAIRAVHSGDSVVAPSTTRRLIDQFASLLPGGQQEAPRRTGRAHRPRARGPDAGRSGTVQRRDRPAAVRLRGHRQDACRPGARQARPARPGSGSCLRLRARPGPGRPASLTIATRFST